MAWFNKVLETFLRDFGPYWHDSITQLLQICRLHIHDTNRSRNRDSSDQATFLQSSVVWFWWVCVNCISSVSCSYLTGAAPGVVFCCWSPSASGLTCCVFRDGILQILVVTSGYLSYCCLSIISNQSVHSPLTSDITRHFHPHNCRSLDIFSFSDHSL